MVVRGAAAIIGPSVAAALYRPGKKGEREMFGSFGMEGLVILVGALMAVVAILAGVTEVARRIAVTKESISDIAIETI